MTLYQHRFTGHTTESETWMFSWWAQSIRTIDAAQAAAVTWLNTAWAGATAGNGIGAHVVAAVGTNAVTTVEVTQATGLQVARRDTASALVGTAVGSSMPADVALVVSLRTALANRSGRGRFYLPQPAVSEVTVAGRVAADFQADMGTALAAAWATYNSGTDRPVVYSRVTKATQNILTFNVGNLYDTQRRRENKLLEVRTVTTMP